MGAKETENSSELKKYKIFFCEIIIHVVLFFAFFEIYISNSLDENLKPVRSTSDPPAERLVLFLIDGLRAESIYGSNLDRVQFLKSVMKNKGSWGIAHTGIPSNTINGNTAILSGVYKDFSALIKPWSAYPQNIDTILDKSSQVWYFGSKNQIKSESNVHIETYDAKFNDFDALNNTILLDKLVFDRSELFIRQKIMQCIKNCDKYYKNGTIFFLHLHGIGAAGRINKPDSPEYIQSIAYVDKSVERISKLFESIFLDKRTTFVLTTDHGMTNWGTHGGTSELETEVPFVIWGAGIYRNIFALHIRQIDIAPLLASVLGLDLPTNSIGVIPLGMFNLTTEQLSEIQLSNALQLMEKFTSKKFKIKKSTLIFIPFQHLDDLELAAKLKTLNDTKSIEQFHMFFRDCHKLIQLLLIGIAYYENYYKIPLLFSISFGLIEWIIYLLCVSAMEEPKTLLTKGHKKLLFTLHAFSVTLCCIQNLPLLYYVYFCFPFTILCVLLPYLPSLMVTIFESKTKIDTAWVRKTSAYLLGIEFIVFGFLYRFLFTFLIIFIFSWVFTLIIFSNVKSLKISWFILCVVLSVFPLLPVVADSFYVVTYISGFLICITILYITFDILAYHDVLVLTDILLLYCQFFFSILSFLHVFLLQFEMIPRDSILKKLSWVYFVLPIVLIPFSRLNIPVRLASIFFGILPFYLLVSSSFEVVFLCIYSATLITYSMIESKLRDGDLNLLFSSNFVSQECRPMSNSVLFRKSFFFTSFLALGFFGIGTIDSMSPMDPFWVRAFLTEYNFVAISLLVSFKVVVPFLITFCVFTAINSISQGNVLQMFCFVLVICDFIILHLLFLVTNEDSSLEVGTSISNLVAVNVLVVILVLLYGISQLLTQVRLKFKLRLCSLLGGPQIFWEHQMLNYSNVNSI